MAIQPTGAHSAGICASIRVLCGCSRYDRTPMLRLPRELHLQMVAHCISGLPDEACGLLAGDPSGGTVDRVYLTRNAAASARVYSVDSRDLLHADRDAERNGTQLIGVFHSHTHTDAYPSPTDVDQAPDPGWHYVVVSLRDTHPVVRSYRIVGRQIEEESVVVLGQPVHASVAVTP
jgi:proteasome lid subunit RPN8/RPN11